MTLLTRLPLLGFPNEGVTSDGNTYTCWPAAGLSVRLNQYRLPFPGLALGLFNRLDLFRNGPATLHLPCDGASLLVVRALIHDFIKTHVTPEVTQHDAEPDQSKTHAGAGQALG